MEILFGVENLVRVSGRKMGSYVIFIINTSFPFKGDILRAGGRILKQLMLDRNGIIDATTPDVMDQFAERHPSDMATCPPSWSDGKQL